MPQSNAPAFAATCERVVGTAKLSSGSLLPLTANPSYASKLSALIGKLNAARAAGARKLAAAKDPGGQSAAAEQLSSADGSAAAAVGKLQPGPVGASANAAIATALQRLAAAYHSLASAAHHNDKRGYGAAQGAIAQADAALSAAFAQLKQDGYTLG
jgi:hypothetical protein